MAKAFGADEPLFIEKSLYEELIRDSERTKILRRIVKEYGFIRLGEIKAILEIESDAGVPELQHPSTDLDDYADY